MLELRKLPNMPKKSARNILWFEETNKKDIALVGGKGANLGEMYNAGVPVPNGFCVTSKAYFDFVKKSSLRSKLKAELNGLNLDNSRALLKASDNIKTAILRARIPKDLAEEIKKAYLKLSGSHDTPVAVRSSATAEDLPDASFAGQQKTFLDVTGADEVVKKVQQCWASLFEARAIFYREDKGFDHFKVGIAVPIQHMVGADVAGIMFTVDPLTNDESKILIEAVYGWGETAVSGAITPDQYLVDKKSRKVVHKTISKQTWQLTSEGKLKVSRDYQNKQKLSGKHIRELALLGKRLEAHYEHPQDIEWTLEGGKLQIVQTRPVTTLKISAPVSKEGVKISAGNLLLEGLAASPGVASGKVKIIQSAKEIDKVKKGEVLVAEMTSPDFVPAMRRAVAIVTNSGGMTSHAAIVSRELGVPCVVGTELATNILKTGEVVTVVGSEGKVYKGEVSREKFSVSKVSLEQAARIKTATKLYVNLAEPEVVEKVAGYPVDGVGLLRAEFMIAQIGQHPRSMLESGKKAKFISELSSGLETFCETFSPRPVVYRTTDFKTSEYRNLKGGSKYEMEEPNPLLGFRGATRYVVDEDVFKMELAAVRKVRSKKGFKNLWLMLPFVRTPDDLYKVKRIVSAAGLRRSPSFKLWLMVEIPANIILLEDFAEVGIDGISIGSNDLTMLTLGVDRDNPKLADYDEMNPAVLALIEEAIKKAHKLKLTSSICGQAPSVFPSLVKKLVKWGITSVSVSPDAVATTKLLIRDAERESVKGGK